MNVIDIIHDIDTDARVKRARDSHGIYVLQAGPKRLAIGDDYDGNTETAEAWGFTFTSYEYAEDIDAYEAIEHGGGIVESECQRIVSSWYADALASLT